MLYLWSCHQAQILTLNYHWNSCFKRNGVCVIFISHYFSVLILLELALLVFFISVRRILSNHCSSSYFIFHTVNLCCYYIFSLLDTLLNYVHALYEACALFCNNFLALIYNRFVHQDYIFLGFSCGFKTSVMVFCRMDSLVPGSRIQQHVWG